MEKEESPHAHHQINQDDDLDFSRPLEPVMLGQKSLKRRYDAIKSEMKPFRKVRIMTPQLLPQVWSPLDRNFGHSCKLYELQNNDWSDQGAGYCTEVYIEV